MANDAAITDLFNKPNYIGELFMIGAGRTPFLNMIGGVDGGNMMIAKGWEFPLAQFYSLESADQPEITETQAQAAATPTTYVTDQLTNYVQVFKEDVSVSYAKISDMNTLTGLAQMGNDVDRQSAMDFQIAANLRQIALDADHTFLNGTAQKGTNNTTAWKTGGVITALSTNTVAGGAAALTRDMIDELVKKMACMWLEITESTWTLLERALRKQRSNEATKQDTCQRGLRHLPRCMRGSVRALAHFCPIVCMTDPSRCRDRRLGRHG